MKSLGAEAAKRRKAIWLYPMVVGYNPPERWGHSASFANGVIYVFGGCCGGLHFSDVLALNLETMSWNSIVTTGQIPGARDSHTTSILGQKMFVFGGTNGINKVNDLHILDLRTKIWSMPVCQGNTPSPRESHTATIVGHDKLVIFGGSGEGESNYLNDVHVLDMKDMTWSSPEIKGNPPAPRDSHTAVVVGNKLLIYGGDCGDRYHGAVDVLDIDMMTWSRLLVEGSTPGVRAGHVAVNIGAKVYIIGGVGEKQYYNDVWVLDIGACTWSQLDIRGQQPQGRFSHTAVVTNYDIAIYGGCGEDERPLNELFILQLGSEHPNGRYNISMCKKFGNQWIQEKQKNLKTEIMMMQQNNTVLKNGELSHKTSEGGADVRNGFLHCTNNLQAKRMKTSDGRVLDIESEQEEHSLNCLSHQSSPSRSDQEHLPQKLQHSTNENLLPSQQLAHFRTLPHSAIRSFCRTKQDAHILGSGSPRHSNNEQFVRPINLKRQDVQYLLDQKLQNMPANAIRPMSLKQIGAEVYGTIDGAFDSGYLMTATVNGQTLKGVLFAPGPGVTAIKSPIKLQGGLTVHNSVAQHCSNPPNVAPLLVRPSRQYMSLMPECSLHIPQVNHEQVGKSQGAKINSDLQGVVLSLRGPGS